MSLAEIRNTAVKFFKKLTFNIKVAKELRHNNA